MLFQSLLFSSDKRDSGLGLGMDSNFITGTAHFGTANWNLSVSWWTDTESSNIVFCVNDPETNDDLLHTHMHIISE